MDVLYNSIDVRDLLSSADVADASSPLSAPDLRLLIHRLQVRSLDIKSKVKQYLLSHQSDFAALFSQLSDVVSKSEHLSDQVLHLLNLISHRPIDREIKSIVEEIIARRREVNEKRELLELLGVILPLSEKLRLVKEDIKVLRVVEAAEVVRDLKAALQVGEEDDCSDKQPLVCGLLKKEWTECFEEIQDVLVNCVANAVRFEQEGNVVRMKFRIRLDDAGGIELLSILKAMDAVGILDYGLAKVADLIIKYIIVPAVNSKSTILFEEVNPDRGPCVEAIMKIAQSADNNNDNVDGDSMYSVIIQIIKFINKSLCFENDRWIRCLGRLTWPRMSELIISNFLSKIVPSDATKLADFQKIIKLASDFECTLKELMFISSDSKDDRLSNYANNVEVHFASRKKVEIVARARTLLLQSDFALPQDYTSKHTKPSDVKIGEGLSDHVIDLLFSSERCVVSEAALELMKLVHQTLVDVCLSSPRVGLEFYNAARDALLLYEVIVPVKLERQLEGINQIAVLVHNDCLYLSREILGLAFEYRPHFPSYIKDIAVFVDLAPRFQLLAEGVLQRQIQLVINNLNQAIDGADGFQNTHQMKKYESARFSIEQVVFIVEKVRLIWEPLLIQPIYKKSMSIVLETVFSRMVKEILLLDDIAAEETLQLQRLILSLLENLSFLLESLLTAHQTGNLQEPLDNIPEYRMPSLQKLRKLADLLDMPLKSITTSWESGELKHCGFVLSEVEDFIRAIFTDSPLRKECLRRIQYADSKTF